MTRASESDTALRCAQAMLVALDGLLGGDGARRPRPVSPGELRRAVGVERVTAVFAELEGGAAGPAGVLLPDSSLQGVLENLVGEHKGKALDERSFSALCELGNIAVSAAANVLSAHLGTSVLPSVPRLVVDREVGACLEEVGGRGADQLHLHWAELHVDGTPLQLLFLQARPA